MVLNVARLHNGMTAIGLWGRGLGVVRAFIKTRIVGRRPLWKRTTFIRSVARLHTEYRANVLYTMFVAALLGVTEQEPVARFEDRPLTDNCLGQAPGLQSKAMAGHLFRLLTPALKGHCSKTAISGLQECMECMGGVGYLENEDMQYNIARLYRDANVMPIWEGTTDMMADDSILRVLFGKTKEEVCTSLEEWVLSILTTVRKQDRFLTHATVIEDWWTQFRKMVMEASREEAELKSRAAMDRLVEIVQGLLLLYDAQSDGDSTAALVADAWFAEKIPGATLAQQEWRRQVTSDLEIVFGPGGLEAAKAHL